MTDRLTMLEDAFDRSCRAFTRAKEKLFEGLEAWMLEKTPHTEDRLQHYYLVYKDCKRNRDAADVALDEAYGVKD